MKRLVGLLKYLLALGLMGWVVWKYWEPAQGPGLKSVWQDHILGSKPIHYHFFFLALFINIGAMLITVLRWYLLVRAQDLPITVSNAYRLGFVGIFFNTFLPSSVGGDLIKAAFLAREQSRRAVAVATVLVDRVVALFGLICFMTGIGTVAWLTQGLEQEFAKSIVRVGQLIVGSTLAGWVLIGFLPERRANIFAGRLQKIPKLGSTFAELWRAVWLYRNKSLVILGTLLISWVGHVCFVATYYFSTLVLHDPETGHIPSVVEHVLIIPIGMVIQALPISPGGIGVGEAAFAGLYVKLGCAGAAGALMALVNRLTGWIMSLGCGLVYLQMKKSLPTLTDPAEPTNGTAADVSPALAETPV